MPQIEIRAARPADAAIVVALIRELATFEGLDHTVVITPEDVLRDGFGEHPAFQCLLAEVDGQAVGFALFFRNYSTFAGRAGIYLEDLFVRESARGLGIGRRLVARLAALVEADGGARLDFAVLHWNPARAFYHRLGAAHLDAWLPYRLSGQALADLAREDC